MKENMSLFGFRVEKGLWDRLKVYCQGSGLSLNELVDHAFRFTAGLHDRRKTVFNRSASGFRWRADKADKVTTTLELDPELRESVRNFAVVYLCSMAEVLRKSLELYLDFLDTKGGREGEIRHFYRKPQEIIMASIIGLFPAFAPKLPPEVVKQLSFL